MRMMLMVDVPDEMGDDVFIKALYITLWNEMYTQDIPINKKLRPLPCKRETRVYWKSVGLGNIPTHEISDYDKGWNDCVGFLESEE